VTTDLVDINVGIRILLGSSPIFEATGPDGFKGIDIMRTARSLDPA
jgi:hypothetical protein